MAKAERLTIGETLASWLGAFGYDGLCGDECGCHLGDLFCCDSSPANCVPGYAIVADDHGELHEPGDVVLTLEEPEKRLRCDGCAERGSRVCQNKGLCWNFGRKEAADG